MNLHHRNGTSRLSAPEKRLRGPGTLPLRIALYSPGMVGIGHMRRNLLIAQTLAAAPLQAVILMIAEAREANVLAMPPGGDCLTLPALCKESHAHCRPRYLDVPLQALVRLRVKAIAAALETFKPDVLIVDHLPRGALRELDSSLEDLRVSGNTRCVLGLRDVLAEDERPDQLIQPPLPLIGPLRGGREAEPERRQAVEGALV